MFLHKVKSDGLAHLSWMIGSNGEAAVIDPRRDIGAYIDLAAREGCRITHVFETHRNEDLVSGAPALGEETGARIIHGPNPAREVRYADTAREGDRFTLGAIGITVLETPGHTDDSLSYVLHDLENRRGPVGVFTGDALFVGDVGRTDFYPDRAREVAGLLFDSLQKLKQLGDHVIIYPAHGAGSVCGSGMAEREFSTIGHERANNERFMMEDRDAFIEAKLAEHHYQPPYFSMMERLNSEGGSQVARYLSPPPVGAGSDALRDGKAQLVDIRGAEAFAAAHVPGALCIPAGMLAAFAGWFLDYDRDILLIGTGADQAEAAARTLARIGYDRVAGHLAGTVMLATRDHALSSVPLVDTQTVRRRLEEGRVDWSLLDVRSLEEFEAGHIEGARHAYVGELPGALDGLDLADKVTVMCGSGMRATIAASVLRRAGRECVDVYYGSWAAWNA